MNSALPAEFIGWPHATFSHLGKEAGQKNAGPPSVFRRGQTGVTRTLRYAPIFVKTGSTGAQTGLMNRSPESVYDITNPAKR